MNNSLLKKLQDSQNKIKNNKKDSLNTNTPFGTLTDEEISLVLALRAKSARISLDKTQNEFSKLANFSAASTYSNFEQKGNISLLNFIKLMRAMGRLQEVESLLQPTIKDKIENIETKQKQRVRKG